jgi:cobalt-precorrin-5B (C1)-methyltransferase
VKKELRSGYTTGACAAAAAKGAAEMLVRQILISEVSISLPAGIEASFQLHGQSFSINEASCFVIKDAGDDPDVTNGAEVWARVTPFDSAQGTPFETVKGTPFETAQGTTLDTEQETNRWLSGVEANPPQPPFIEGGSNFLVIEGGIGIGRVTKPGLAIPPGEWAINPVPRRMIEKAVGDVLSTFNFQNSPFDSAQGTALHPSPFSLHIQLTIPDGEERAKKTLNARLGIIGGLSILGTTGIVRPISAKAWTDTIDTALDVAKACGCPTVVLSTGRTSEMAVQNLFKVQGSGFKDKNHEPRIANHEPPAEEAYIMMGDHVAYSLRACMKRGFTQPIIACQFAKLLKIACGHENTHAAASVLDLEVLRKWAEAAEVSAEYLDIISHANTAREIAIATGFDNGLMGLVTDKAKRAAEIHAPGIQVRPLLCGYDGTVNKSI